MRKYLIVGVVIVAILLAVSTFYALTPSRQAVDNKTREAQAGEIRGRVVDALGQPVPKAKLHLGTSGSNPTGRIVFYRADEEGNFSIKGLPPGVYNVFSAKEEDGYPDTDMIFFSTNQTSVPQAVVSQQQPTAFVTVQLGSKSAMIAGSVVNAVTGAPIGNATMTFSRPENPLMTLTTSLNQPDVKGGFNFLLPSAPVTMTVTAPGYAVWNYRNEGSQKQMDLLTLEPGKTKELVVSMRPLR
ncbi:MAG: carboxypeptidase regulatory-like domain-containing protein [Pyrinomonadaceae bacterium]